MYMPVDVSMCACMIYVCMHVLLCRAVQLFGLFSLYLSILHLGVNLLHVCRCTAIHNCSSSGSLFFTTLRQNS